MARGKKYAGRKKGTPNKTTASVRDALIAAFDQLGGVPALKKWAAQEPAEFYKLWAKLLPQQINQKLDGTLNTPGVVIYLPDNGRQASK